jgi:hypothetical protein
VLVAEHDDAERGRDELAGERLTLSRHLGRLDAAQIADPAPSIEGAVAVDEL